MEPIPDHLLQRKRKIAERLVEIEMERPGSIRLKANPMRVPRAVELLEPLGFKKRFFASSEQFAIDCFLSHIAACDKLLLGCVLAGPRGEEARIHCWNGLGNYHNWKGILALTDFTAAHNRLTIFVVNIAPIFSELEDLLAPIPPICRSPRPKTPNQLKLTAGSCAINF